MYVWLFLEQRYVRQLHTAPVFMHTMANTRCLCTHRYRPYIVSVHERAIWIEQCLAISIDVFREHGSITIGVIAFFLRLVFHPAGRTYADQDTCANIAYLARNFAIFRHASSFCSTIDNIIYTTNNRAMIMGTYVHMHKINVMFRNTVIVSGGLCAWFWSTSSKTSIKWRYLFTDTHASTWWYKWQHSYLYYMPSLNLFNLPISKGSKNTQCHSYVRIRTYSPCTCTSCSTGMI